MRSRTADRLRPSSASDPEGTAFAEVEKRAFAFASVIEQKRSDLREILESYESHEVIEDEVARSLDLFSSLHENAGYFTGKIGSIATFLPRNQPLYALSCFALVTAMQASKVLVRTPVAMRSLLPQLGEALGLSEHFPEVELIKGSRANFISTALHHEGDTHGPQAHAVIFTGTPAHAEELRRLFPPNTLFIANGSGHNPVVVTEGADLDAAVSAVSKLQFYNSGQDCAAPNAVLVHTSCYNEFLLRLRAEIEAVTVGDFRDATVRVGTLGDQKGFIQACRFLIDHSEWLDPSTPGLSSVANRIVWPAVIAQPLSSGGNYQETYAPIVVCQMYRNDAELASYFESPLYAPHAMYVSVYGSSGYLEGLAREPRPPILLRDTHLHAPGVERGTQPYGGFGRGASSVSIGERTEAKPTLPQREIWRHLIRQEPVTGGEGPRRPRLPRVLDRFNIEAAIHLSDHERIAVRSLGSQLAAETRVEHVEQAVEAWRLSLTPPERVSASRAVYQLIFGLPSGPPLAGFIKDADLGHIRRLLDV